MGGRKRNRGGNTGSRIITSCQLNRWKLLKALLLSTTLLFSCSTVGVKGGTEFSEIITRDTVWSGDVLVDGVVLVRKGATLKVEPGTVVKFSARKMEAADDHEGFSGSGIKVEGRLVARGSKDDPVRFTSAEGSSPGSWDRIYFDFSRGSVFENCIVEFGSNAVHAHFSDMEIIKTLFKNNYEGVRLGGCRVSIRDSVFTRNRIRGINFKDSRNVIRGCAVYGNGVGIFLHSKDSKSIITGNAIYGNERYDLRVGDLHATDINVGGNWWGTKDPERIEEIVYDGGDQGGIGMARYFPYLPRPTIDISAVKGFIVFDREEIPGTVYALVNLEGGFDEKLAVTWTRTTPPGSFEMSLPPGRYFIFGRSKVNGKALFGFTGNNPVNLGPFEETLQVIPMVSVPGDPLSEEVCGNGDISGVVARVVREGKPVEGVFVYAYDAGTLDFRGPGIVSGVTSGDGYAELSLPPGNYILMGRKRGKGRSLGMVEHGGMFGVSQDVPVLVKRGCMANASIPMFIKEGIIADEDVKKQDLDYFKGLAYIKGKAAAGHIVYFYNSKKAVGRPTFISGRVSRDGSFTLGDKKRIADGEYFAFLRKAFPGSPGGMEKIEAGPVRVKIEAGAISPSVLEF